MEKEIIAALVTACASIMVSLISLLVALILHSKNKQTTIDLEKIKNILAIERLTQEFMDEELKLSLQALKEASKTIQKFKHTIQILLSEDLKKASLEYVEGLTLEDRNQAFAAFEESHSYLSKEESAIFHQAKNVIHDIDISLFSKIREQRAFKLNNELKNLLSDYRDDLSELQNKLGKARHERLSLRGVQEVG